MLVDAEIRAQDNGSKSFMSDLKMLKHVVSVDALVDPDSLAAYVSSRSDR